MGKRNNFPKYGEIEKPLLLSIIKRGGSIYFSIHGDEIEDELADHFDLSDNLRELASDKINAKGNRKWRNMIQYARRSLVDEGYIDNKVRDRWKVTPLGYSSVGKEPPKLLNRED